MSRTRRFVVEVAVKDHMPDDDTAAMLFVDWLCEADEAWGAPTWVESFDGCDLTPEPQP